MVSSAFDEPSFSLLLSTLGGLPPMLVDVGAFLAGLAVEASEWSSAHGRFLPAGVVLAAWAANEKQVMSGGTH